MGSLQLVELALAEELLRLLEKVLVPLRQSIKHHDLSNIRGLVLFAWLDLCL